MVRLCMLLLAGCLVASAAAAQPPQPRELLPRPKSGVWAAYSGEIWGSIQAPAAGRKSVGHTEFDGWTDPFAVQLDAGRRESRWRGRFRRPGDMWNGSRRSPAFDWGASTARFGRWPEDGPRLWKSLLDHHAPPLPFIFQGGKAKAVPDRAGARHQACARPLVAAAFDRAIAVAQPPRADSDRKLKSEYLTDSWPDVSQVEPLLRLLTGPLVRAQGVRPEEVASWQLLKPEQAGDVTAHGDVYRWTIDFLANPAASFPPECGNPKDAVGSERTRDQCVVTALVDRRDGWPFSIDVERVALGRDGGRYSGMYRLQRLRQARVPIPPNPCA